VCAHAGVQEGGATGRWTSIRHAVAPECEWVMLRVVPSWEGASCGDGANRLPSRRTISGVPSCANTRSSSGRRLVGNITVVLAQGNDVMTETEGR
jgi:hypothetical protein